MFRYDKEKWENRRNELNKNINDIMFKKSKNFIVTR